MSSAAAAASASSSTKHYYIIRYRWSPKNKSQWPYFSFLARLHKPSNTLIVPFIEIKDGKIHDPFNIRRLVAITELTQIGAQSIPDLKTPQFHLSVYTIDIYQARAEPLLEGGPYEHIFEDEINHMGRMFGTKI